MLTAALARWRKRLPERRKENKSTVKNNEMQQWTVRDWKQRQKKKRNTVKNHFHNDNEEHPSQPFVEHTLHEYSGVFVERSAKQALRCDLQRVYSTERLETLTQPFVYAPPIQSSLPEF